MKSECAEDKGDTTMKQITAVIKPIKLDDVRVALAREGVKGMTVSEVRGFGQQGGHVETFRGAEYEVNFVPKVQLTLVVVDEAVDGIIRTLAEAAGSGSIGDGKIWVTPVERIVRIRTGEEGTDAV
jgi:nitrogen regulatory protein P-II 1